MYKKIRVILISACLALLSLVASAVPVATSGSVAGEWTSDWGAARALAKANNTYYFILLSKQPGTADQCAFCNAATAGIWDTQTFRDWSKANNIPLVYADAAKSSSSLYLSLFSTYPGITAFPTLFIVDGTSATGKQLIKLVVVRNNRIYSGVTLNVTADNFIEMVNATMAGVVKNDVWDKTATLPGDETAALATSLEMAATNRLHGAHTLNISDTNDWFSAGLVAGQRYHVAVTNVTIQGAAPRIAFYSDYGHATNGNASASWPLAVLTNGYYFAAQETGTGYIQVARPVTNSANVTYSLVYRKADQVTPYPLSVRNAGETNTPSLHEGEDQTVEANDPPEGQIFTGWQVAPAGSVLGFGFDATRTETTVTMPDHAVTLTAKFEAESRLIRVAGALAFGNVRLNGSSQKNLTVFNDGNTPLAVTSIDCPAGFSAAPTNFTVAAHGSAAVAVTFNPVAELPYGGTITLDSDKTGGTNTVTCSGRGIVNQPPVVSGKSPAGDPAAVTEGASSAFSVTANDSTDPDTALSGMVSVSWYVDDQLKLEFKTGAPNAITSAYTLKTDTTTVQGVTNRDVIVKAVALDKQGGTTETVWTLRVNNAPVAQTIIFPALSVKALGDADFSPGATSSSGVPVIYTSANTNVAEIVGNQIHIVGTGTSVITASQPGTADYKAAAVVKKTLTVSVRVTATVAGGTGGSVSGSGIYLPGAKVTLTAKPVTGYTFLRWDDGLQTFSRSITLTGGNVSLTAYFGLTAAISAPTIDFVGAQSAMVGVLFNLPLTVTSDSLPTVTVTGLLSGGGLAYNATTKTITGVPTKVTNPNLTVTIKAKNAANTNTVTQTFTISVAPLPTWAYGTFDGYLEDPDLGSGAASLSKTLPGSLFSGKFTVAGTNYTFSAASYTNQDENGTFWLATKAKAAVGKAELPLLLSVRVPAATGLEGSVTQTLSVVEGWFVEGLEDLGDISIKLYRNVWKDAGMASVAANYTGYYTVTLPHGEDGYGSGYLTITVDKAGGVKTSGKLADGTVVSMSSVLDVDEAGRFWTVLYTVPAAYTSGGCFFGLVEFVKPTDGSPVFVRLLDAQPLLWNNRNPQATAEYGEGFLRAPRVAGGLYDKLVNLYTYYTNKDLTVSVEQGVDAPALAVGTNRYESAKWNPDGLSLFAVTNSAGTMTGIKGPTVGAPTYVDGDWAYDNIDNTVGLTFTLTRATGIFSGASKAWFDYATTHTSKPVAYQGVITPVREDMDDEVGGRGFFLWADKGQYLNVQNKETPYSFNWSYDFVIETTDQNQE